MITVDDVTAEQLAQARGCKPGNVCWWVCVGQAADVLTADRAVAVSAYQLDWINAQTWT